MRWRVLTVTVTDLKVFISQTVREGGREGGKEERSKSGKPVQLHVGRRKVLPSVTSQPAGQSKNFSLK